MTKLLLVGSGGFIGSSLRYLLGGLVHRVAREAMFPWGTMVVNVLGCLLIGLLAGLAEERGVLGSGARAFLLIGLLGGFTTFSSFGLETLQLLRDGQRVAAAANVIGQVVLGLGAVWAGVALARLS